MRAFLMRNPFLVLGVSLPLLLVALVLAVQTAHRWGAVPPATPVLYVHSADWVVREYLQFEVAEGRLQLELRVPEHEADARQFANASLDLAVHDPRDGSTRIYPIEVAVAANASGSLALRLPPELTALVLDPSPLSPDGARLVVERRSSGGLFGELFGFGGATARYRLMIDEVGFKVPGRPVSYGSWPGFIAWVVEP